MRNACARTEADHGQHSRARAPCSANRSEEGAWLHPSDNANFRYTSCERAFGSFKLQDHSTGNLVPADEVFNLCPTDGAQHLVAVEHARDVGEENQTVGADELRCSCRHVIGIDVVKFAISAEAQAGSDWDKPGAPERTQKIDVDFGEIADES